ncbi:MAG: citrate/2-methylcitrate synthase, partial [bacterium]
MGEKSLTITDNRTGKTYQIPIDSGAIKAMDLRGIKVNDDDFGLLSYDPGYKNTASTKSTITFVDGEKGILQYRGYPIEQIAKKSSFLETAYLILFGELPNEHELNEWTHDVKHHTIVHENIKKFINGFRYDAHPMGMLISTLGALSTFYPEARQVHDPAIRKLQIKRLISKAPTIAAFIFRHSKGLPYVYPRNDLSYAGNFLNMMFRMTADQDMPNKVLESAMDVLFILHADHEQNCSTTAMRTIGSSDADPFVAAAGAAAALYGPLHGGANEQVLRMLREIG